MLETTPQLISGPLTRAPSLVTQGNRYLWLASRTFLEKFSLRDGHLVEQISLEDDIIGIVGLDDGSFLATLQNGSVWLCQSSQMPTLLSSDLICTKLASDGTRLCSMSVPSDDARIANLGMCNLEGGKISLISSFYCGVVSQFAFRGSWVVAIVGEAANKLLVHNLNTGSIRELPCPRAVRSIAIHPSLDELATGDVSGAIHRWSLSESSAVDLPYAVQHWHATACLALSFTADGSTLLSGGNEGVLCMWHRSSDRKPQFIPRLGGPISHISVSQSSSQFACVSVRRNNSVIVIDLFERKIKRVISGVIPATTNPTNIITQHPAMTSGIAIPGPTSVQLFDANALGGSEVSNVRLIERNFVSNEWSKKPHKRDSEEAGSSEWVCTQVAFTTPSKVGEGTKNGTYYMGCTMERLRGKLSLLKFFQLNNPDKDSACKHLPLVKLHSVCLGAHKSQIVGLVSPDPHTFVSAAAGPSVVHEGRKRRPGELKVWAVASGGTASKDYWHVVRTMGFRGKPVEFCSTGPEGLLIAGFDEFVTVWNPHTGRELTGGLWLKSTAVSAAVPTSSSSPLLAAITKSGNLSLWDLQSCTALFQVESGLSNPTAMALAEKGFTLVIGDGNAPGTVVAWRCDEGTNRLKLVKKWDVHKSSGVKSICGVNSGESIAAMCNDGSLIRLDFLPTKTATVHVPTSAISGEEEEEETEENRNDKETIMVTTPTAGRVRGVDVSGIIRSIYSRDLSVAEYPSPEAAFNRLALGILVSNKSNKSK